MPAGWLLTLLRDAPLAAHALGVATGAAVMHLARRRRRRAAEARRARLTSPPGLAPEAWAEAAARGEVVALRGRLAAGRRLTSVVAVGFGDGRELHEVGLVGSDEPALETGGGSVRLDGPCAVEVGTHVIRHWSLPPEFFEVAAVVRARVQRAQQLRVWPANLDAYHVRHLAPGDAVVARGRLERDEHGWRLTPAGDAITLAAPGGEADAAPLDPKLALGRAVAAGAAAWALVVALARLT